MSKLTFERADGSEIVFTGWRANALISAFIITVMFLGFVVFSSMENAAVLLAQLSEVKTP